MDQNQPKESRTDRFIDLAAANTNEPPKPPAPAGLDAVWAVKSAACAVLFLALLGYFSVVCKAVLVDYLILLTPTVKATVPWLIKFAVSGSLLLVVLAVTAVLLRPAWVALLTYLAGAVLYALIIGGGLAGWIDARLTGLAGNAQRATSR